MLKTILIVEPNPYHGVVLPGLTFYFQKLGYNITVLWRIECKNELPFCYFKRKPTLLYRNIEGIRSFLRSKASEEFDYIFFASNSLWEPGYFQNGFIKYLDFIPKGKKGTFYIEHNLNHITEDANSFFLKTGRVFTLFPFKTNTGVTKMINTTYFGDFPLKAKSKLPHFIVVGNINQKTKNFKLLIDTAQQLLKYKYKFRITIVGNGLLRVPTKLKKYIYVVGKLNYPKMYTLLRKADFFCQCLIQVYLNIVVIFHKLPLDHFY